MNRCAIGGHSCRLNRPSRLARSRAITCLTRARRFDPTSSAGKGALHPPQPGPLSPGQGGGLQQVPGGQVPPRPPYPPVNADRLGHCRRRDRRRDHHPAATCGTHSAHCTRGMPPVENSGVGLGMGSLEPPGQQWPFAALRANLTCGYVIHRPHAPGPHSTVWEPHRSTPGPCSPRVRTSLKTVLMTPAYSRLTSPPPGSRAGLGYREDLAGAWREPTDSPRPPGAQRAASCRTTGVCHVR